MQKTTQTNLNNRLASKSKNGRKARSSKNLFSQRRLSNLGLSRGLRKTIEFLERVNLCESVVQVGTVAGFRGIRGDIYVRATNPVWELFSSQHESPGIFDRLAVFFRLENKFFEAVVSRARNGCGGFYFSLEGLNTRTEVANLRFSEVLVHKNSIPGVLISQIGSYVGFIVLNIEGKQLGTILEIGGTKYQTYLRTSTTIIPNVSDIVVEVKKDLKTVVVDWSDSW